ncbi:MULTISPECIES: hypothetical protein [Streptomyces]|uniref:hypothetical protein n=1 Tax=Streptomyces griseoaurantiacus TaxID=68213 RepID=UPI002E2C6AC7|nr:hypothetical protein [Streptomyces jietaisiensis]
MRCYWDEEDIWFYLEVDDGDWVIRQVELEGPERTPITAASLAEWRRAQETGRLATYESSFGITAERPVSEGEDHDPEPLTCDEFEQVWNTARRRIADRPS